MNTKKDDDDRVFSYLTHYVEIGLIVTPDIPTSLKKWVIKDIISVEEIGDCKQVTCILSPLD